MTFTEVPGGTEVQITHKGFHDADSRANHDQGWDAYLTGLGLFLGGDGKG